MLSRNQFSTVVGVTLFVFYFSIASCEATDRYRSFDSGQPRELINQPVCWPSEQPDPLGNCDLAKKA